MNKWVRLGTQGAAACAVPLAAKPADRAKWYAKGALVGLALAAFGKGDMRTYGKALGFGCLGAHCATSAGTTGDLQADAKTAWVNFKAQVQA